MPRLQLLSERFLRLLRSAAAGGGGGSGSSNKLSGADDDEEIEMPPPTLARDLSSLVGDPEFADVRFIAEGRAIVAHRFMLEARCAYFRGMFRSGMAESGGGGSGDYYSNSSSGGGGMVDVVVPGAQLCFAYLCVFFNGGSPNRDVLPVSVS